MTSNATNTQILRAVEDVKQDVDAVRGQVESLSGELATVTEGFGILRHDFDGYVTHHAREHEIENERFLRIELDIKEMLIDVKKLVIRDARDEGKNDVLRVGLGFALGIAASVIATVIIALMMG